MRLAILSRNRNLHSIKRLLQEARKFGVRCDILDPLQCQLLVDDGGSRIFYGARALPDYDAVLPRIGASVTDYGLAVVRHFEAQGNYIVNPSHGIAESRNKLRCLQALSAAGLRVPTTVLMRTPGGVRPAVAAVGGMPVVLKVLQGTQGVGVMLVHTPVSLASVLDTFWGMEQDVMIQRFIAEGAGRDYRAFVVGGRVVAAMLRTAPEGEFRSNIHRGGEGRLVDLPRAYRQAAVMAARKLGLELAGVDMMESKDGPVILEVNSSPGFEGIERATGINIAGMILKHIRSRGRKPRRRRRPSVRKANSRKKRRAPARRKPSPRKRRR